MVEAPSQARIQHPNYHYLASDALKAFKQMPASEQEAIKSSLAEIHKPADVWIAEINETDIRFLCVGENHTNATRAFLARVFFSNFDIDTLLLEARPEEISKILRHTDNGSRSVALLDADISAIVRQVKQRNPGIRIKGIEETLRQRTNRAGKPGTAREDSILANLIQQYSPDEGRYVVLFGARHCGAIAHWLYPMTMDALPELNGDDAMSIRVISEHQEGPLEAFIYFLDTIGMPPGSFALINSETLHPWVRETFLLLWAQMVNLYDGIVVIRTEKKHPGT
ncbi:MAG: hypothetical protein HQ501_04940 [Rhodospirillales bacterium]|nr:hypothetical protein [Rhodospirillales bacterium]